MPIEDVDEWQRMPSPDFEIVEVMRGGNLDRAAARFRVGIFIGHDRYRSSHQGQYGASADKVGVALIFRMDGDPGIAQHRFGPGRGDGD
jgi:hypothetical protein